MVLRGDLVNMMALTAPEVYRKYVAATPDGKPILYVKLCKALYGCLRSALLFYRKLWKDLHGRGFVINPYDPCSHMQEDYLREANDDHLVCR